MLFISMFLTPIRKLINFIEQFQSGATGFSRFCELMDQPIEVESEHPLELEKLDGHICFSHVSFNYADGKEVLKDVNFWIFQVARRWHWLVLVVEEKRRSVI